MALTLDKDAIKKISILYAEDDDDIREQTSMVLKMFVKDITSMPTGADALVEFESRHYDMVISDISMPKMDGLELSNKIKEISPDTPIILTTAHSEPENLIKAINSGVEGYIIKPLNPQLLLQKVDKYAKIIIAEKEINSKNKLLAEYKKAVDASSIVSMTDSKGIITYANEKFCNISGYSLEELVGSRHNIVRHPEIDDEVYKQLWETITDKRVWKGVIKNISKNNNTYWVDSTIVPMLDEENNIKEYMSIRTDVTDLMFQREMIEQMSNAQDSIVAHATNHGIVYLNNKFFEYFNFISLHDFQSQYKCLCELFLKEEGFVYEYEDKDWKEYILQNPDLDHKAKMVGRDGNEIIFSISISKVKEDDYVITLFDTTKLQNALDEAKIAQKAKENFLANMSHEIRTPLNGVIGFIDLLKNTNLDDVQYEYVDTIHKSAQSLTGIINDILDFSKIESGKFGIESIAFCPKSEFESVKSLFMAKALEKSITLNLISDDLPVCVKTDPLRIKQILNNLVSNAIKFTPEMGTIDISIKQDDERLYFSVKDSGCGIPEDKLDSIFKSFEQVDNSVARTHGGTGLGLAISSKLAQMLGGELKLDSTFGDGSEFYFDVRYELCSQDECDSLSIKDVEQKVYNYKGSKVLVAEDNKINQKLIQALLDKYNISYDIANDGQEAYELYKQNPEYDLIFMDVHMPNLDGIGATKEILAYEFQDDVEHTPITALTANAVAGDKERFLEGGMDDYLSKPIDKDALEDVLARYLKPYDENNTQEIVDNNTMPIEETEDCTMENIEQNESIVPTQSEPTIEYSFEDVADTLGVPVELISELIEDFFNSSLEDVDHISDAIVSSDYHNIEHYAHSIKGAAANLRLNSIADIARVMEHSAKESEDIDYMGKLKELLEEMYNHKSLIESK
jgi:PAS domain S-box-containing protein